MGGGEEDSEEDEGEGNGDEGTDHRGGIDTNAAEKSVEKARIAKVAAIEAFEGYKNARERFRMVRTETLHVGRDALAMI